MYLNVLWVWLSGATGMPRGRALLCREIESAPWTIVLFAFASRHSIAGAMWLLVEPPKG